jgi:hypothetical protein
MRPSLLVALAAGACGGHLPAGSCDTPASGMTAYAVCITYTGTSYDGNSVMAACSQAGGTYSPAGCTKGPDGTCTFNAGKATEHTNTYDALGGDAGVDFQSVCEDNGGTFSSM